MPPPNEYDVVVQCRNETGNLINRDTTAFTDYVARVLHAKDPNWGRKARSNGDWESRNPDALAYLMDGDVSHKHLVDVVINSSAPGEPPNPNAAPAWQVTEGPAVGNGYWMVEPGTPPPDPPDPPTDDLQEQVNQLEADVASLDSRLTKLTAVVSELAGAVGRLTDTVALQGHDLAQLQSAVLALASRVGALENALAQPVRTGQTLYHSHSVTVAPRK